MKTRIAAKIYESDQYQNFESHAGNRGLKQSHIRNLATSMKEHGWIDSFPMACRQLGSTFMIVDGHNRFEAAKLAEIPVKYSLINGAITDNDLCMVNRTQKRWTTADFVKSYSNLGYDQYTIMQYFMEEHNIGVGVASALLTQANHDTKLVESGDFAVLDEDWAETHIFWLKQINGVLPFSAFKRNFVACFIGACLVDGFKPDRLVRQIKRKTALVIDYASKKDMQSMLETVYNYGFKASSKIPLAFLISQVRGGKS